MTVCYLGLGSNVGDRLSFINSAIAHLRRLPKSSVLRVSSVYETDPIGPPQPDYLNAVVELETELEPLELLDALKQIEREVGRKPRERHVEREIDIDLLVYGDAEFQHPRLTLPHPCASTRAFVLVPLCEVNKEAKVGQDVSASDALSLISSAGVIKFEA